MTRTFDADSTADDVLAGLDLQGRRVLVTGVSAGLGVETARALAARGAAVVGAARDLGKAQAACEGVRAAAAQGGGDLRLVALDLADLASVRAAVDGAIADAGPFDLVVANAGVMATPLRRSAQGHELQFATNVLGHYALLARMAPRIADGGRIVVLSSAGHRYADVDLDDPDYAWGPYDRWEAYGRSKTGDVLLAVALDARLRRRGVRAAAVHPGGIDTELGRHIDPADLAAHKDRVASQVQARTEQPFRFKTVAQGAATTAWAATTAGDAVGGRYCEDCHVAEVVDEPPSRDSLPRGVRPYAIDPDRASALLRLCADMTGEPAPQG